MTCQLLPSRRRTHKPSNEKTPGTGPGAIGRERPEEDDRWLTGLPLALLDRRAPHGQRCAGSVGLISPLFTCPGADAPQSIELRTSQD